MRSYRLLAPSWELVQMRRHLTAEDFVQRYLIETLSNLDIEGVLHDLLLGYNEIVLLSDDAIQMFILERWLISQGVKVKIWQSK